MEISSLLLQWYSKKQRNLPWRLTNDPYRVWLSEVILQQTRVAQGIGYYDKFVSTFPTIKALAMASEEQVLKLWQGLGYYSRARNLHATAKFIYNDLSGKFPCTYDELLKLKGVGPYTAAAISSICFDEVNAVVDGNVYRVLSRVFNIHTSINSTEGVKEFQLLADKLICHKKPGDYNQAIMELGAIVCKPKKADCVVCPLVDVCVASSQSTLYKLPVKEKKIKVKKRFFNYFCVENDGAFLFNKRDGKDIWKNLYDFPLEEVDEAEHNKLNAIASSKLVKRMFKSNSFSVKRVKYYEHKLSHQHLHITIHHLDADNDVAKNDFVSVSKYEALKLPVPKPIERFLSEVC